MTISRVSGAADSTASRMVVVVGGGGGGKPSGSSPFTRSIHVAVTPSRSTQCAILVADTNQHLGGQCPSAVGLVCAINSL